MSARNNIARRFPRSAKIQLVRWAEVGVDGVVLTPSEISTRAADTWPDLPAIHSRTWKAWAGSAEYSRIRDLVCEEDRRNTFLLDEYQAAGADEGMDSMLNAASYALACKAASGAADADDYKELRALMQTIRDAQRMRSEALEAERNDAIAVLEREHDAQCAEYEVRIRSLEADHRRYREAIERAGINLESGRETIDLAKLSEAMDDVLGN